MNFVIRGAAKRVGAFVERKLLWATLTLVWSLYAVACLVPAVHVPTSVIGHGPPVGAAPGLFALVAGAMTLPGAVTDPAWIPPACAWLANPLLVIGSVLLCCRRPTGAMVAAIVALLFSTGCWMPSNVWDRLLLDRLLVGYYLWVASIGSLAVGAWFTRRPTIRQTSAPV